MGHFSTWNISIGNKTKTHIICNEAQYKPSFILIVAQIPIHLNFIDFDFWTQSIKLEIVKNV